ncbi:unnamed protein product [Trichobilharzia szidati]|nr:unnamed protein product [Trichobilharzia szidati]
MFHFDAFGVYSTYKSQESRKVTTFSNVWFFFNLFVMILTTVTAVVFFKKAEIASEFFMRHSYVVIAILSVGVFLLLVLLLVTKIHSDQLAVTLILRTVIVLWSVAFAAVFDPVEIPFGVISLAITLVITLISVVLALKLPPLNRKGVVFFVALTMVLAVIAVVANILCYLSTKEIIQFENNVIFCVPGAIYIGLFIAFVMFICLSVRRWIKQLFYPNSIEFILSFTVWFLMISLFIQVYTGFTAEEVKFNETVIKSTYLNTSVPKRFPFSCCVYN